MVPLYAILTDITPDGPAGGVAQLVIMNASDADTWDRAVDFCRRQGWAPLRDEPDLYFRATDTELYVLERVDGLG